LTAPPDLLLQELHADGTPRRPMNAYMASSSPLQQCRDLHFLGLFRFVSLCLSARAALIALVVARHRRPDLLKESPGMKTGLISQALSKEWHGLDVDSKAFYHAQAKILKDTFHRNFPSASSAEQARTAY
jgi:hypothetical protein